MGLIPIGFGLGFYSHEVFAESKEIITNDYTVQIPTSVEINGSTPTSFTVSGKAEAQVDLNVSVSSKNNYKLKNKSQEISYSLDKESFHIDNKQSASSKSFDENFNIALANTNINYSGNYKDRLTFNIGSNKYTYELDMNSILDGVQENGRHNYGSADVYINGILKAENVSDFREISNYGDTYEFKNIKATDGHHFVGINSCANTSIKGRIGVDTNHLWTRHDNPYNLIAPIFFEFNTNKLTINYHADGAQSWKTANVNNASEIDVTGKDIMETEALKYDELYSEDAEQQHFCSIARIKRDGYTAKANTWKVGQKSSLEVLDYKTLQRAQDIAEYCGVLNEFKKDDTTIDLYPIWIPNTYTLTYDLDGGSFNASTTQLFKYGSGDAISSEIPIKTGYDFVGWKWGDVIMQPGDTIPKGWGNFTLTAQWKKQYTLTFDANGGIVSETSRTVLEGNTVGELPIPTKKGYQFYGWYINPQYNEYYIINSQSTMAKDKTIIASWGPNIDTLALENKNVLNDGIYKVFHMQSKYSDYCFEPNEKSDKDYNSIYLKKDENSDYSLWQICHDSKGFVMFINTNTGKYLDLDSAYAQGGQKIQLFHKNDTYAQKWIVTKEESGYKIISACNPNFVLDLPGGYIGDSGYGRIQTWYNNDTIAQRWNFKKVQTPGTQINIENNTYTILKNIEGDKYLVLGKMYGLSEKFQSTSRADGLNQNTYENCDIDKYLENTCYNGLSDTLKSAIQPVKIKQVSYSGVDISTKQEEGPNGQVYNTLERHVFLPSVEEIAAGIGIDNSRAIESVADCLWLRDSFAQVNDVGLTFHSSSPYIYPSDVYMPKGRIAPAFVIDLSKIDYTVTGTVNYK